jgi:hypothetical protein
VLLVPVWLGVWLTAVCACTPTALNMAATAETANSPFKVLFFCIFALLTLLLKLAPGGNDRAQARVQMTTAVAKCIAVFS